MRRSKHLMRIVYQVSCCAADVNGNKEKVMNIEYLKYFVELARIQHYGKAAKMLNIC